MVVALTPRQWKGLREATGLHEEFDAVGQRVGLDLNEPGNRWRAARELAGVLEAWFRHNALDAVREAFDANGVCWDRYLTFRETVVEECTAENALFSGLEQPGIGSYPVPGSPFDFKSHGRVDPVRAPGIGQHTDAVLRDVLGLDDDAIAKLRDEDKVIG